MTWFCSVLDTTSYATGSVSDAERRACLILCLFCHFSLIFVLLPCVRRLRSCPVQLTKTGTDPVQLTLNRTGTGPNLYTDLNRGSVK